MTDIQQQIEDKDVLILDGAWGTRLSERGLTPGLAPETWNFDKPDEVLAVAQGYVEAGSDIILTNTFGGNRFKLEKAGLADRVVEVNRRGVEISREAAGGRALVFASMGPTGQFMEPLGPVSKDEMVEVFAEQARGIREGGADGIVIETMTALEEALAALEAARDETSLPVVVCMTYDKGPKGYATMMGVKPGRAGAELDEAGADFIGCNCGSGIENMIEVVEALRPATLRPIWAKANAGMPELVNGETVFRETPEQMAARLPDLVDAGARLVGGCCGTTPEHIRALVAARDRLK